MKTENFTKNFKKHFKQSGLTQAELGQKINISQGAISKIMSGKEYPRLKTMIKLIETFETNFESFFKE